MRPEAVLGFDPTPGNPGGVTRTTDAVHQIIRCLVDGRAALDAVSRVGSIWDGATGAPIADLVRRYSRQLSELEELLIDCRAALEDWRVGLEARQRAALDLAERMADLTGADETAPADSASRREQLTARARELETEHQQAARGLSAAFETLSAGCERLARADRNLADEVDAAARAWAQGVEEWVAREGPALIRTAVALGEVAALTTVISELVGVAALDRTPGEAAGVRDIISRSPAAHRLIKALHQRWLEVAPALPEATFGRDRRTELADAIAGRLSGAADETDA